MADKFSEFKPIRESIKRKSANDIDNLQRHGSKIYKSHASGTSTPVPNAEEIEKVRFENGIEVDKDDCVGPILRFSDSNLRQDILEILSKRNIVSPTPVQMQAIPVLLSGKDLIAIAPTGSGKTFAYLVPLINFLKSNVQRCNTPRKPYALIIAPTRELMQQILDCCKDLLCDEVHNNMSVANRPVLGNQHHSSSSSHSHQLFAMNSNVQEVNVRDNLYVPSHIQNSAVQGPQYYPYSMQSVNEKQPVMMGYHSNFYSQQPMSKYMPEYKGSDAYLMHSQYTVTGICGGVPIKDQVDILRSGSDIIVGTPGRIIDLCQRNIMNLDEIRFIVLDECDKMLDMGLEEQLRKLFAIIMSKDIPRQTSLWSATLPDSLERLARSAVIDPITIHIGIKDTVSNNITQNIVFMHTYQKEKKLLQTLRQTKFPPVLVFTSSIVVADEVTKLLKQEEFFVGGLHSHLPQPDRFKVLAEFRSGKLDVLVATDLASRGLDIPDITHVINYDTPNTIEDYIHRCGRTGRFGRPGQTTTFLTLECKIAEDLRFLLESTGVPVPNALKDTKQFGKKVLKTEFGDRVL